MLFIFRFLLYRIMVINMIRLQSISTAFLKNNNSHLLMKRAPDRQLAPGLWSGVGGKLEPCEYCDPYMACLREIEEETSIKPEYIKNLELRYIIIRRSGDIIRQNYIYIGETSKTAFTDTAEGKLHWKKEEDFADLEFTETFGAMLQHYFNTPDPHGRVVVGVAGNNNGSFSMTWGITEDFC